VYDTIVDILKKEYGQRSLYVGPGSHLINTPVDEISSFLLSEPDVERCLDVVEVCFRVGDDIARSINYISRRNPSEFVDGCIEELNGRFKEAGCGYEFVSGNIIRIDSQFLHAEVVKPAIGFLNGTDFEGPREEFFAAYEHYRHGNHEDALVCAAKSFESTLKVLLVLNGKTYEPGDTASKLILACKNAELIPSYNEAHLNSLTSVLTSGIPTLRNKNGGHGRGEIARNVKPEVVAYGLHLTASAMVMLVGLQEKRVSTL
jgi:hypothetical protein